MDFAGGVIPTAEALAQLLFIHRGAGRCAFPDVEVIREALSVKEKENKEWDNMLEAQMYTHTYIKRDAEEYAPGKKQKGRKRRCEEGELETCGYPIGKGKAKRPCKLPLKKSLRLPKHRLAPICSRSEMV
jgi:hypothetical protein